MESLQEFVGISSLVTVKPSDDKTMIETSNLQRLINVHFTALGDTVEEGSK